MMIFKDPIHYSILNLLLSYVIVRFDTLMTEVLIFNIDLLVLICIHSPLVVLW